ncbi:MAG: membrane protein insertion efficiency factor YidD [Planctomycetes bacterium]|nr:membrane protein insertion efficiency factor YidD [Planctomycetota bacterium]
MRVLREAYLLPVHAYRKCVSPWMPPACRYTPSCSAYFVEAVRVKGVFVGTLMGIWRIMRCNPWSRGGYDPVK